MEELIKYFEGLEVRLDAQDARIAALEAQVDELEAKVEALENRPAPEPQVVERIVEKVVEKPGASPQSNGESGLRLEGQLENPKGDKAVAPQAVIEVIDEIPLEEPKEVVETPSPKAAIYGKAVDDIRLAISLGDRFLYQRELFGQNAELMQRTLTELNALGSFDEALNYISRFNWDSDSPTYQQFIVTLHRRFG